MRKISVGSTLLFLFPLVIASTDSLGQSKEEVGKNKWNVQLNQVFHPYFPIADDLHDVFWDDRFTIGGPSWSISAMVFDENNDLFVGGWLSSAGNEVTDLVARWDGSTWSSPGEEMRPLEQRWWCTPRFVGALALENNGSLLAGGSYLTSCSYTEDTLARLDGSSWSGIGGMGGEVTSLAVDSQDAIYAGGRVGVNIWSNIVKWDGSSWSDLGLGFRGFVHSIVIDEMDQVYAADDIRSIKKWNGSEWTILDSNTNGRIGGLALDSNNNLYAGGAFDSIGANRIQHVAKWDGGSWNSLGQGLNGPVSEVIIDDNNHLIAAGSFDSSGSSELGNIARWDGNSWSSMTAGLKSGNAWVFALDRNGVLHAAGRFVAVEGGAPFAVAKWDGTRWRAVREEPGKGLHGGGIGGIASGDLGQIYVVGSFTHVGDIEANGGAKWNGEEWTRMDNGLEIFDGFFYDLVRAEDGTMYAAGYLSIGGNERNTWILRWDGSSWSPILPQMGGGIVNEMIVDADGNLYVGGKFDMAGGVPVNHIAKWDGVSWSAIGQQPAGVFGDQYTTEVDALEFDDLGNLYVGGLFETAGGITVDNIAKWDGQAWSGVGGGMHPGQNGGSGRVFALKWSEGILYAGGSFIRAGTTMAYQVASWDGTDWSALGPGFNAPVFHFEADSKGDIYVTGQLSALGTSADMGVVNGIARWDGSDWHSLGSGLFGNGKLAFDGEASLYVTGTALAGNKPSIGIARWDIDAFTVVTSSENEEVPIGENLRISVFPNPSRDFATVELELKNEENIQIGLYDTMGKFIREIPAEGFNGGDKLRLRIDNSELANGNYVLKVNGASFQEIRMITVLR